MFLEDSSFYFVINVCIHKYVVFGHIKTGIHIMKMFYIMKSFQNIVGTPINMNSFKEYQLRFNNKKNSIYCEKLN